MSKCLGKAPVFSSQPQASVFWHIKLTLGISNHAVFAGLVMIAEALHGAVVLRHMKINGPRAQVICHFLERFIKQLFVLPIIFCWKQPRLRRVVAHGVKQGMGHIRLEADGLGTINFFQCVDHVFPGMHATPTDLALGCEAFAIVRCHTAGFPECLGNFLGVGNRVFIPFRRARRGIDAHHAIVTNSEVTQPFAQLAGLFDISDKFFAIRQRTHC